MKNDRRELEAFYTKIQNFGSKPGLTVIKELLSVIGHPEKSLNVVHIVGTNGKGSSAMMLEKILLEGKYKTGVFTSPSFTSFDGGIRINGGKADEEIVLSAMAKVMESCKTVEKRIGMHPTSFEVQVAVALLVFKDSSIDYALVEAGLGGRLDATNVFEHPEGVLVTSIGIDHQTFLGDTLSSIASHKAGVIKPFSKVVSQPQSRDVERVLMDVSSEVSAKLVMIHKDAVSDIKVDYRGTSFKYRGVNYRTSLIGMHQAYNASGVIRLLERMNLKLSDSMIRQGLLNTVHPGRFEVVKDKPLVIVDGAHNVDGMKALVSSIRLIDRNIKFKVVMGVMRDKAVEDMAVILAEVAEEVLAISVDHERSMPSEVLSSVLANVGISVSSDVSVREFMATESPLLIVGSLYIQSEVKRYIRDNL